MNRVGKAKEYVIMALDVASKLNNYGIDTAALKQVSQEILKRANANTAQFNVDAVKPVAQNVRDLGLSVYNKNIDVNVVNQIAMNNSGIQIHLNQGALNAINSLNAQAAAKLNDNIGGRITFEVREDIGVILSKDNPSIEQGIISFATDKDKNGSQTPYKGELLFVKKKDDKEIIA